MGNYYSTTLQPEASAASSNHSYNPNTASAESHPSWYNDFVFEDPPEDNLNQYPPRKTCPTAKTSDPNRNVVKQTKSDGESDELLECTAKFSDESFSSVKEIETIDDIENVSDKKYDTEQLYLAATIKEELIVAILNAYDKHSKKRWKVHFKIDRQKPGLKDEKNLERRDKKAAEKLTDHENVDEIPPSKIDELNKSDDEEKSHQKSQEKFETRPDENYTKTLNIKDQLPELSSKENKKRPDEITKENLDEKKDLNKRRKIFRHKEESKDEDKNAKLNKIETRANGQVEFDPKATSSKKAKANKKKSGSVYIVENNIRIQRCPDGTQYAPRLVSPNTSIQASWMSGNDRAETLAIANDASYVYDLTMKDVCEEYGFSALALIQAIKHSKKGYIELK